MASTQELLTDSLRDILDAEKQAVKSIPRIARAASSQELKQALQQHLEITKGQVARLEQAFELLGEKARGKKCKAMEGLVAEAMEHMQEHEKGDELDAILIASAQKVEHYEIAAYGSARALANASGQKQVANLLQQTLKEEGDADKQLTKVALGVLKQMARGDKEAQRGLRAEEGKAKSRGAGSRSGSSSGKSTASSGGSRGGRVAVRGGSSPAPARASKSSRGGSGSSSSSSSRSSRAAGSRNPGRSSRNSAGSQTTTDHDEIRRWAEERGAHPACVKGTGGKGDTGMIRLDFPGYSGEESLQEISWDDWFDKFDSQNLALLYQNTTARGQKSNFNKLVSRETAELSTAGKRQR